MVLKILTFPDIDPASAHSMSNAKEMCELFIGDGEIECGYESYKVKEGYPFFESGAANPNLIGAAAVFSNDRGGNAISHNYLSNYNIVCNYPASNGTEICVCNPTSDIASPYIRHQVIDGGNIIVSGKNLYHVLKTPTNPFSIEFISDGFGKISGITDCAFNNSDMTEVKFPYNNENDGIVIGKNAFSDSENLRRFFCYHGIKKVGAGAFSGCTSLSGNEISCNDSIAICAVVDSNKKEITIALKKNEQNKFDCLKICFDCDKESFKDCSSIKRIMFYDGNTDYSNYENIFYRKTVNGLSQKDDKNLTPIPLYFGDTTNEFPKYKIGAYAFANCTSLNSIGGYKVDIQLHNNCIWTACTYDSATDVSLLTSDVVIPKSIDLSGYDDDNPQNSGYCFANCTGLNGTLYFEDPSKNVKIGKGAFSGCSNITGLDILDGGSKISSSNIGDSAFKGCNITDQESALGKIADDYSTEDIHRIFN
jgi:hypothetical protein